MDGVECPIHRVKREGELSGRGKCSGNMSGGICPGGLPLWRYRQRRGTRCLATVIGESGFEVQAGRIIVSGLLRRML